MTNMCKYRLQLFDKKSENLGPDSKNQNLGSALIFTYFLQPNFFTFLVKNMKTVSFRRRTLLLFSYTSLEPRNLNQIECIGFQMEDFRNEKRDQLSVEYSITASGQSVSAPLSMKLSNSSIYANYGV